MCNFKQNIKIKKINFSATSIKDLFNIYKLIIYIVGTIFIILMGKFINLPDWDIYLSILMPTITFLTSGITTGHLIKNYLLKNKNVYIYLLIWLFFYEFNVDLLYVYYNQYMNHMYFRIPNYIGSSILYLLCCLLFSYKND